MQEPTRIDVAEVVARVAAINVASITVGEAAIGRAVASGATWAQIGAALGVSAQGATSATGGCATPRPPAKHGTNRAPAVLNEENSSPTQKYLAGQEPPRAVIEDTIHYANPQVTAVIRRCDSR